MSTERVQLVMHSIRLLTLLLIHSAKLSYIEIVYVYKRKPPFEIRVLFFSEMLHKYSKILCVVNRIIKSECRAQNSFPNGSCCPPKIRVYHEIRVDCGPPTPRRDK